MRFFFALILISFAATAIAKPIEITVTDYGWLTSFPVLRDTLDFYLDGQEDEINSEQPIIDPSRVNLAAAHSSLVASKGLGTDYPNDPQKYLISLGVGGAWDAEKNKGIKDEISGAAAASELTFGGRMDLFTNNAKILGLEAKKLMGFVSFGTFSHSEEFPGKDVDIAGRVKATNFGIHFRYDLVEKSGSEMWGWGGLKLHTGYEYNVNDVELRTSLDEDLEVDLGGAGILAGKITGDPIFDVETRTHSFPMEISTSVLFLKVLTLYGGYGADFNFGKSEGTGDVKGDVEVLACTSGLCASETVLPQLKVEANYDAQADVRRFTHRTFLGLQLDLPLRLHFFVQATHLIGTEVNAAAAGFKYTF